MARTLRFVFADQLTHMEVVAFHRNHPERGLDYAGTFDALHYGGMAAYKIGVFLLNLAPLIGVLALG